MDPESRLTHALSSIVSGLVAATMGTPADVVKTRVMNQPFDAQGRGNELFKVFNLKVKDLQSPYYASFTLCNQPHLQSVAFKC